MWSSCGENNGNKYLVSIHESKNDMPRQFIIGDLFYKKVTQYMSLRPEDRFTDRFFIQYHKGKCQRQVIGKNKIGETPQIIAAYLNLENPKQYTGHCFRRTGATLLSNSGASTTMLKQLGGWKSITIAQGYVENSLKNREKIYECITNATVSNDHLNPQPSTSKNYSSGTVTANKNLKTTGQDVNSDDFSDDFIISEDDLVTIDKLNQLTTPEPPITSITTRTKRKVLTEYINQLPPTHFMRKPPISVFAKKQENEPPLKMRKSDETNTHTSKLSSECLSKNLNLNNQIMNYQNCIFTGDITSNYSNIKFENCVFYGSFLNNCDHSSKNENDKKKQ
ncbi:uncharacterized protein [Temnothorax longispinosus]